MPSPGWVSLPTILVNYLVWVLKRIESNRLPLLRANASQGWWRLAAKGHRPLAIPKALCLMLISLVSSYRTPKRTITYAIIMSRCSMIKPNIAFYFPSGKLRLP